MYDCSKKLCKWPRIFINLHYVHGSIIINTWRDGKFDGRLTGSDDLYEEEKKIENGFIPWLIFTRVEGRYYSGNGCSQNTNWQNRNLHGFNLYKRQTSTTVTLVFSTSNRKILQCTAYRRERTNSSWKHEILHDGKLFIKFKAFSIRIIYY